MTADRLRAEGGCRFTVSCFSVHMVFRDLGRLGRKGQAMDFIERWFGISPDGGSGATEMMIIVVFAALAAVFIWRRILRRRINTRRDA